MRNTVIRTCRIHVTMLNSHAVEWQDLQKCFMRDVISQKIRKGYHHPDQQIDKETLQLIPDLLRPINTGVQELATKVSKCHKIVLYIL